MKTISVVIPVYNQVEYLADALDSVFAQTRKADDIIVVDDGSTDGSGKLADKYRDRVKVIHQLNKGLPSARNTGIMNSECDYIFFLDADDMMTEKCLEKISDVIEEGPIDIVAPSFKCFGKSDAVVILAPKLTVYDFIKHNRLGYFCAIRRKTLKDVGGYNPRMIHGWEDYELWFDLLSRGATLSVIQEPLMLYRIKESSMYTESVKHSDELWAQIKKDFPQYYEE